MNKRVFVLLSVVLWSAAASGLDADTTQLTSKPVFGKEARVITYLLDNHHFRKIKFNDSLSAVVLNNYFLELDNSKLYFLASDISSFDAYKTKLDDMSRAENVTPAFQVYAVFQKRYKARINYVIKNLVGQPFDFSVDESYESDRDKATWSKTQEELNEVWRKIIKGQALALKLTGKSQPETADILTKRFDRLLKAVEQMTSEDVFGIYMNCITEAYDPHTNYLSPKATDLFKQSMSLSLEGIGARLQTDNEYTKVVQIIPGGPADKSKLLHANDLISGVAQGKDGEMVDVVGWRIDEVVKLIKGPKGTEVRLQVLPAQSGISGPPVVMSFIRDKVKLEDEAAKKQVISYSVNGRNLKLGVISLPSFYMDFDAYQKRDPNYRSTTRDVRQLIKELKAEGIDGLVMDLRNNGGGSLPEAIDLTGLFIKEGPVVQVRDPADRVEVGVDDDNGVAYDGPLVVMTNRFSASASEIFAGAIQDYHRGVIVGESTFGKGTVQQVLDLGRWIPNQEKVGQLNLTSQKFYRVTGSSTQNKGVTPDIQLPSAFGPQQFGESSRPNALPWDVIKKTEFQRSPNVTDKLVASLAKDYQDRLKFDSSLKQYVVDVAEAKKNYSETVISLNETKRRKEMDDAKARAAERSMDTKVTKEGLPSDDLSKMKDEPLREGLLILSDILTKHIG
ncbi:MAG: carboxy terminal-processing peptidase [Cyclobacteriaceae bacterium]|nr:carboxy terminal-processing peptidase [Cyclobacteriaceae bacterium]